MATLFLIYTFTLCLILLFLFYCIQKRRIEIKVNRLLQKRTKIYLDLINATSDCIIQADLEGKIIFINHSGARMYGYESPSDVCANTVYSLPHYADPADREMLLNTLRQKGKIENIRLRVKRANGENFWVQMAIHFQKDSSGNVTGVESIQRDVTDLVTQEMQLRHNSARLEEKNNTKKQRIQELETDNFNKEKLAAVGQIASILVHELRNPLSSIKMGMTTLHRRAALQDADRHIVEVVLREVSQLERIMRDILNFSRPGRTDFIKASMNDAIRMAMDQVAESYRQQGVVLQADMDHGIPQMHIDVNKITQIFVNLFMNALKASELGCHVVARTQHQPPERCVIAEVEDDGSGMTPETLERALEPFFSGNKEGTGLGLTIVEQYVKIHNGAVQITSEQGKGTTVTIRLPLEE